MDTTTQPTNPDKQPYKRYRSSEPVPATVAGKVEKSTWPRFLVIESQDPLRPMNKLSPFVISKAISGLAGEPKSVKKLGSGQLLVEVDKKSHSDNLLKSTKFVDVPVVVSPHRSMNTCRGVVRSRDLEGSDEVEMVSNLKPQGVVAAKRISIRRNGEQILTNTYILTFGSPNLPTSIKAGFVNIPVSPFIPNPLRCFKCQRFGHHKDNCKRNAVCARCGQEGHDDPDCRNELKCANCKSNHCAYSKECPQWLKEKEIQRIRTTDNITFPEARKVVEARSSNATTGQSYATVTKSAAKPSTMSVSCQTDHTWLEGTDKPTLLTVTSKPPKAVATTSATQTPASEIKVTAKPLPQTQSTEPTRKSPDRRSRDARPKSSFVEPDRLQKGSKDIVGLHNRYGPLDTTLVPNRRRSASVNRISPPKPPKPRYSPPGKSRVPVLPPPNK